jgi:hypothetical protein
MNERINQLAEQADAYAKSEYEKWIPTPDFSGIPHIRKIFNEKFAELIVQECIDIISPYTVTMSRPGEEYLHPIQEIKTTFRS